MDRTKLFWATLLILPLVGCGGGASGPAAAGTSETTGPDVAVFTFLEAVRKGDDNAASGMLTAMARKKTTEMQLAVAPPGSATASFEVSEFELVGEDGAHVASKWTDVGEDGKPHSDDIVWMLRRDPEGWRIAGMATKLFEDLPPLMLNFEDPEDMIRQQQMAEQEYQRRKNPAAGQAQSPAASQAQKPADAQSPVTK